jgi:F0F1-type ATP synthase assembly protein I
MKTNYFEIDKHGNLKKTNQNLKKKRETKKDFFSEYININVGYSLVTPILIGVIIGLTLDNKFRSKPVFTVLFIFLGTVSSFYNLFKLIKQNATYQHKSGKNF